MSLERVFEPITIGTVEIPNRIARAGHGTHLGHGGYNEDIVAYHLARARGGCGLSIVDSASVHASSQITLANTDDSIIPGFHALMQAVRPHGMRVFHQLYHGGHITPGARRQPGWSASAVPNPVSGAVPEPMGQEQIEEIVAAFAAAAARCREGGLDGVEVHAAHGYLLHQFLSPLTNRRSDGYGGALENRARLLREVLRAIRARVGHDFVLGVRVSASQAAGGVTEEELNRVLHALAAERLIDYVSASQGDYYDIGATVGGMERAAGYQLASVARTTAGLAIPRLVSGRFRTLQEAGQVLREGSAEMVSMVRAHIADPDIVRKTRAGRVDEVRPCIGCNQGCIGGLIRDGRMGCLVNPAAGFEASRAGELIVPAKSPRRVLVVGGGPAGLEAARVAALAGHRVTVLEASSRLGGMAAVARQAPNFHAIGDIVDWLEREVYRLGVQVRLSTPADADAVRAARPDALIVATGSLPRDDGVQFDRPGEAPAGAWLPHVVSAVDVITARTRDFGRHALVLDDTGHFEAVAAAESLIARGIAVTWLTRFASFAPYVETTLRAPAILERLHRGTFTVLARHRLLEIGEGICVVRPTQGREPQQIRADTVVLVTPNLPARDLHDELGAEFPRSFLAGDALAPRDMQTAIADGHRVARMLG